MENLSQALTGSWIWIWIFRCGIDFLSNKPHFEKVDNEGMISPEEVTDAVEVSNEPPAVSTASIFHEQPAPR